MNLKVGDKFVISGMTIEIVSDAGDRWETRNITTKKIVFLDKSVLLDSVKLGKAEKIGE